MDPATIFQVVCGAIQLIQLGINAAKAFNEIYNSKDALTADSAQLDRDTEAL